MTWCGYAEAELLVPHRVEPVVVDRSGFRLRKYVSRRATTQSYLIHHTALQSLSTPRSSTVTNGSISSPSVESFGLGRNCPLITFSVNVTPRSPGVAELTM